ncbi:unnamed protein product, partial [Ectocarpus sp. 12 AP-2014]
PPVRRRGIATEVLMSLAPALADAGICALHFRLNHDDETGRRIGTRAGFDAREGYMWMTRPLS